MADKNNQRDLDGNVAIVTGAASGIGRAWWLAGFSSLPRTHE